MKSSLGTIKILHANISTFFVRGTKRKCGGIKIHENERKTTRRRGVAKSHALARLEFSVKARASRRGAPQFFTVNEYLHVLQSVSCQEFNKAKPRLAGPHVRFHRFRAKHSSRRYPLRVCVSQLRDAR